MFDQSGLVVERTKALAFGNGVLYLSNPGTGRNGAPRGLYSVDPDTGIATFLFDPQFQGKNIVFSGLGSNDDDGLLYGVAQVTDGHSLLSVDPDTQIITEVVDLSSAPGNFESFDGVEAPGYPPRQCGFESRPDPLTCKDSGCEGRSTGVPSTVKLLLMMRDESAGVQSIGRPIARC